MFVAPIFRQPSRPGFVSATALSSPKSYNPSLNSQEAYKSMFAASDFEAPSGVTGIVEDDGYCTLHLDFGMTVSVAPNGAVLLVNSICDSKMAMSACGSQTALLHPQGRVFKYGTRIEIQTVMNRCIRNAKIWPRGVSFTSNQSALVYLVDQAGARSTTDTFRDLYAVDIAQAVFEVSAAASQENPAEHLRRCITGLQHCGFWIGPNRTNHWKLFDVSISQTADGMVTIERLSKKDKVLMRSSPNSGKVRLQDNFFYSTASLGKEPHIFVKSHERRLHHNGDLFVVRNGGHSAGIDARGKLNIF